MGIGAELKEFVAAFESGWRLSSDRADAKDRKAMDEKRMALSERGLDLEAERLGVSQDQFRERMALDQAQYEDQKRRTDAQIAGVGAWDQRSAAERNEDRYQSGRSAEIDAVQSSFMTPVSAAIRNPYALAVVDAYGQHESGYSPKNASGTWQDGKYRSGGVMSWNGPRYENMVAFTGGDLSPEKQGEFFVNEDPELIARLNQARSVEEANKLLADAWRFVGYDGGPEYHNRLGTAKKLYASIYGNGAIPDGEDV